MDAQPRTLTVQDVNMLCNFAELVVREVEKKHVVRATLYSCHSVVQHIRLLQGQVHTCNGRMCQNPTMSCQADIRPAA